MVEIKEKIRPSLVALNRGEKVAFDIKKMKGVRTQASEIGIIMERRFNTHIDREERVIIVERVD